mmetsp:Transcript_27217/g.24105  ORF Transcript_27217/g.24105 Transcript_27217/m.24105 type:complete len:159 (-) Transcript_27217:595-1071(-)
MKQRYSELFNGTETENFYIQSTQVTRTLQSARSYTYGLFSLFPEGIIKEDFNSKDLSSTKKSERKRIYQELSLGSIINDFEAVEIHTSNANTEDQTIAYANCPILMRDFVERTQNRIYWAKYDNIHKSGIYSKLAKIFGISEEKMSFIPAYILADLLH